MDEFLMEFLKKQGDLSEIDFAKKAGMSRPMLYLIKKGRRKPGRKILDNIFKVFPDLIFIYYHPSKEKVSL